MEFKLKGFKKTQERVNNLHTYLNNLVEKSNKQEIIDKLNQEVKC